MSSAQAGDTDSQSFAGTIVSWRPMKSTMVSTMNQWWSDVKYPNFIQVKHDANTKIFVDDKTATLIVIERYMPVPIEGRMREGQLFIETAISSSALPTRVRTTALILTSYSGSKAPAESEKDDTKGVPIYVQGAGFSSEAKTDNFQLAPNSPGYHKAEVILYFCPESQPDMGAQQSGTLSMVYGGKVDFVPPTPKR